MQLVPPCWLLSRSIRFGLHMKYLLSKGEFSISPMVVGTSRLINSDESPAFLAVQNTRKELKTHGFHRSGICIPRLKNALTELFEQQKASPVDIDRNGNTLLYVSKIMDFFKFASFQY